MFKDIYKCVFFFPLPSVYSHTDMYVSYVFLDLDPANKTVNGKEAKEHTEALLWYIKRHLSGAGPRGVRSSFQLASTHHYPNPLNYIPIQIVSTIYETIVGRRSSPLDTVMRNFYATGKDDTELANDILSVAIGTSVEYSQAIVNVINFYLLEENAYFRRDIEALCRSSSPEAAAVLEGYVREALRMFLSLLV